MKLILQLAVAALLASAPLRAQTDLPGPLRSLPAEAHTSPNGFGGWDATQAFWAGFIAPAATGLGSGTYVSGIAATGSATQTCTLASFNGGNSGGTATVALTGTNTIATGTALVITAAGTGSTGPATSATAGSGTATCSGTAVVAVVVGNLTWTLPDGDGASGQVLGWVSAFTLGWVSGGGTCPTCVLTTGTQTITGVKSFSVPLYMDNSVFVNALDDSATPIGILGMDNSDNVNIGATFTTGLAEDGWLLFWAQGHNFMDLTYFGELQPVQDAVVTFGDLTHNFSTFNVYHLVLASSSGLGLSGNITIASQNDNGNFTNLEAAASVSTSYDFALPPNPGTSGFVLQTDGTGATSWIAPGACTACVFTTGTQTITGVKSFSVPLYMDNSVFVNALDDSATPIGILGMDNSDNVNIGATFTTGLAEDGWLLFWAQGHNFMDLTYFGELQPVQDAVVTFGDLTHNFSTFNVYHLVLASSSGLGLSGNITIASQNDNGNFTNLEASASVSTSYTFALPPNPGTSGYVLQTNGAGATSWVAPGAGACPTCATFPGGGPLSAFSPITFSSGVFACATCLVTGGGQTVSGTDTFTAAQTFGTSFPLSIVPGLNEIQPTNDFWSLGDSSHQFSQLYIFSAIILQSSSGIIEWGPSDSANLNSTGGATFTGAVNLNDGFSTGSTTSSQLFIGAGNFYDRTFTGGAPSCSGVTNGWLGLNTTNQEFYVCIGGTEYHTSALTTP